MNKSQANNIYIQLNQLYPNTKTALIYSTPSQLLVAVILSAQCTDKRVNIVTNELFKQYSTFKDFANISNKKLIKYIKSTGFYNTKSKHIIESCKIIVKKHNSKLPTSITQLIKLPGIGRKTANILISEIYERNEGIAIDTHNLRLANRLGLSKNKNPLNIEKDLIKLFPKKNWNKLSLLLIEHGRNVCKARNPLCNICSLRDSCLYYSKIKDHKV